MQSPHRLHSIPFVSAMVAVGLFACTAVDPLDLDLLYICTTDEDCLAGFVCDFGTATPDEGVIGACKDDSIDPTECRDLDQDGFFAPPCPGVPASALDCNDNDPTINPAADEVCNGIDDNCNGIIDENQPLLPCELQIGVCRGSTVACIDGEYPDCAASGAYGPNFEVNEVTCDGLDNDCDGVTDPIDICQCTPGASAAVECGEDTGSCTRGIQFCRSDFTLSSCVAARLGRVCESDGVTPCERSAECGIGQCVPQTCEEDADCGDFGYCVEEVLEPGEDLFDGCVAGEGDNAACVRQVCRFINNLVPCDDDDGCGDEGTCVEGFCQSPNVTPRAELCNGMDDNCNGLIDDDFQRADICGPCPFNMLLVPLAASAGASPFICVDRYEASRPDATADDAGEFEFYATPRPGVVPWTGIIPDDADTMCSGRLFRDLAGTRQPNVAVKRLCTTPEFRQACGGVTGSAESRLYPYTDVTDPEADDVYVVGACVDGSLGLSGPALTGSTTECCVSANRDFPDSPICDLVGNVAEWAYGPQNNPVMVGGSYLDDDPDLLSCGNGTNYPPAPEDAVAEHIGFRCCTVPRN